MENIDEIYLQKRIKTRKITLGVTLGVCFLLALAIIIMACVNIDLKPHFINNPNRITVVSTEFTSDVAYDETSEDYDKFINTYNDMFRLTALRSLFSGRAAGYTIVETDPTDFTETTSALKDLLGNSYVKFTYDSDQKFYNKDGSEFTSMYGADVHNLTFKTVYFSLSDTDVTTDLTFYFSTEGYYKSDKNKIVKVTVPANTYSLYQMMEIYR